VGEGETKKLKSARTRTCTLEKKPATARLNTGVATIKKNCIGSTAFFYRPPFRNLKSSRTVVLQNAAISQFPRLYISFIKNLYHIIFTSY